MRLYDYEASPNCYKARLALAELNLEYERVPIDIFGGDTLSPDFAAKNPALTTPVLEIADDEYLPESNAILLYLSEGTDLLPEDKASRAQVHRWLFFEQARIVPFIGGLRFRLGTGRLSPDSKEAAGQRRIGEALTAVLAQQLDGRDYMVGDGYTVADLCLYGYMHVAHESGIDTSSYPSLEGWFERVRSRPRHVADLTSLPANARVGESRSIYDAFDL
jgi:glutathione S-transferase